MKITLSFPPSILRPNDKSHWSCKNPAKLAMKEEGIIIAKSLKFRPKEGNIGLKIDFYPPNNRWDLDAMLSAAKPNLDGLAIGLGVNDKRFRPITIDCPNSDPKNPRLEITLILDNNLDNMPT